MFGPVESEIQIVGVDAVCMAECSLHRRDVHDEESAAE